MREKNTVFIRKNLLDTDALGSRTLHPRAVPPGASPPPGHFSPWIIPSLTFPPRLLPPTGNSHQGTSPPTLLRFVARFARVRIGDSMYVVFMYTFHGGNGPRGGSARGRGSNRGGIVHGGKCPGRGGEVLAGIVRGGSIRSPCFVLSDAARTSLLAVT